ncbi:putative membrane protein [Algoriphagus sp. 4150]|uniref:DUF4870 domain-containing protein n=1 Tax=Algoriphagus sp. 4150 TaxID=2817756 RepID=UPI00285D03D6|nr:hypothetical protein [Algoriphagus sp. 4150]MDR7129771.1 putative membrane protein [Algoriphagus sp. 4150]
MDSQQSPHDLTSASGKAEEVADKSTAIIAYITLVGLIIAFVMNNEKKQPFASFHIRQSLGIVLTGVALGFINIIPFLGWVISLLGILVLIVLWILGLMSAIQGQEKTLPVVGKHFQEWFKSI